MTEDKIKIWHKGLNEWVYLTRKEFIEKLEEEEKTKYHRTIKECEIDERKEEIKKLEEEIKKLEEEIKNISSISSD
jgi:polyhydroxyalkanoate synthesis regulator phasin